MRGFVSASDAGLDFLKPKWSEATWSKPPSLSDMAEESKQVRGSTPTRQTLQLERHADPTTFLPNGC
jgi:hypothetical protein